MRNASLEDSQLLAESEILQRDLFVAAKDQKDHPKEREDCVQHEAGSVSASSLKINRLRDRWDLARDKCLVSPAAAKVSGIDKPGARRIQLCYESVVTTPAKNSASCWTIRKSGM